MLLKVYCVSSCYRCTFPIVHTLQCGLDLQGKRIKRKRKLQAEGGEEDMAVGEMSFITVVLSSVNVTKSIMTNERPGSCQHTQGVRWGI